MGRHEAAKLGVNIDHIATLRQARGTDYPSPIEAARLAIQAGADQITVHLREDRRHIQDTDVRQLKEVCHVPLNLEMAVTEEMLGIAADLRPDRVTLVPEKRQELTTEGGLDLRIRTDAIQNAVGFLQGVGIAVSLFIDPELEQLQLAKQIGAQAIELQTGSYAEAVLPDARENERQRMHTATAAAAKEGFFIAAGHGLHLGNIHEMSAIVEIREFNIGHSIVSRALFVGLPEAVREMKAALQPVT